MSKIKKGPEHWRGSKKGIPSVCKNRQSLQYINNSRQGEWPDGKEESLPACLLTEGHHKLQPRHDLWQVQPLPK